MSKTKKSSYNDKYNGRDDDEEEVISKHSSHKEYRLNLRKERALKTRNIEEFAAIEDPDEEGFYMFDPDLENEDFYDVEDSDEEAKKYIVGSR